MDRLLCKVSLLGESEDAEDGNRSEDRRSRTRVEETFERPMGDTSRAAYGRGEAGAQAGNLQRNAESLQTSEERPYRRRVCPHDTRPRVG